jgi:ribonucleotide reductase alpha subunit/intein/homing endonuclease
METLDMRVTKRNGELKEMLFDKILTRIKKIGQEVSIQINYQQLVMKVIDQLHDKILTTKIDELLAEQCASLSTLHPDYGILAGRIIVSNHQKNTSNKFSEVMESLYMFVDIHGENYPLVSEELWFFVKKYKTEIDNMIDYNRDYLIDYFGFKTLERAYLFKKNDVIIERPQHMWMRVAIGIHGDLSNDNSLELVKETYNLMSQKYFTHATPTLFNSGTPRPQLSSCYLIAMEEDSIEGIYNTLKDCALISKYSGGIGLHIHNIRSKNAHIKGTNGKTDGLVPMLRVFNNTARYVNQCFTPDTWVYSKRGPEQMKNITTNDELITNDGSFKKVNEVIINQVNKEILEIRITNSMFPVKVTKEHELYLIKNQKKMLNYNVIKNRLEQKIIKPDYFLASELCKNDLVGFPLPTFEKDNNLDDLEYYKFYGMMLGDGHICRNEKESGITLGLDTKYDLIEFTKQFLIKRHIKFWENYNKNCISIKWSNYNNITLGLSREILYDNNSDNNKQINNDFLHLPKHKILKIIEGLLRTDGSNLKELYFYNTSRTLIMQLRYLLLRLGILTSGNVKNQIGKSHVTCYGDIITHKKISYCLRIPKHNVLREILNFTDDEGQFFKYFEWNGFLWGRIKNIKQLYYEGPVYDFNMIDNHNYLTDMGLVHNSGKRNGSFAIYLEPWHADIFDFLELRKNHGDEEMKARDLFYALWVSDLFMERVKEKNGKWSLFCPHECPGLSDVYGEQFKILYEKYEVEGKARKTVNARDLWFAILDAQMETGTPYLLYKDACNEKSNQKNIGTIKSSNLCTEIIEYSDDKETAVCNLASIGLPSFVNQETKHFDYDKLHQVTKVITNNLNKVIDINFYPTEKTKRSNFRHRPIGIGVQGLADTFVLMDIPFHSDEARQINKQIFETIYHASLEKSNEIAIERTKLLQSLLNGPRNRLLDIINEHEYSILSRTNQQLLGAYSSFEGSPASQGILQFDMWSVTPSNRYDWTKLKEMIKTYGLRNSLLVAPMPTASTSQILGYNECFEPFTSNLYSRRTLAGEFVVVNKYLMRELIQLGYWNEQIKNNIIANKGSIQQLNVLPEHIRNKYKIVWEIPMKHVIDMAADRGPFICQSQSLNLWMEDPVYNKLTSMHFYAWEKGLKTGIYYLRRKAKHQAQQFTIEPDVKEKDEEQEEICEMCSA